MAIYKKNGGNTWYAEVYVRHLGRHVCFSTRKQDEAEAREVERLYQAAHNRSIALTRLHKMLDAMYGTELHVQNKGTLIASAYGRYAERLAATGSAPAKKTLYARRAAMSRFVKWRNTKYPACLYMGEVTRTVAGAFATEFNQAEGLSDKSKREVISDLGTVWNALMAVDETIRENPWRFFRRAVKRSRQILAFTPEEEGRILAATSGTEWHTASLVSRWTGLRLGDVCALTWEDVDWTESVIRSIPSKTKRHKIVVTIPLARPLLEELSPIHQDGGPILPRLNHSRHQVQNVPFGPFSVYLAKAKVDTASHTFHSWRHTFVTRGGEAGVSRELLMKMAGHTTELMSQHYDHSERLDALRGAMDAMARQSASAGEV